MRRRIPALADPEPWADLLAGVRARAEERTPYRLAYAVAALALTPWEWTWPDLALVAVVGVVAAVGLGRALEGWLCEARPGSRRASVVGQDGRAFSSNGGE